VVFEVQHIDRHRGRIYWRLPTEEEPMGFYCTRDQWREFYVPVEE
jgi:hypothetical protein